MDEATLVKRAKSDPHAFGVLYDRYVAQVYGYIYRQTSDEVLAQDVTAVTFEKALRHIQRFRWQGKSVVAWLYRIARNELIQQQRRKKFIAPWQKGQLETAKALKTNGRGPETAVQNKEQTHELLAALDTLTKKDREILILRFFEELSSPEVAEILGCSAANVYVRLHRALRRLRQQMEPAATREITEAQMEQ